MIPLPEVNKLELKQPLVSVGMPTYNRPELLNIALGCISKQTYKNLEIIVSDNCSPDPKVAEVVREFQNRDNRIRYYKQTKNTGGANFEFVLEKSTGEYFMWAADDDEWDPTFIEECMTAHMNNPWACLAFTDIIATDSKGEKYRDVPSFKKFSGKTSTGKILTYIMDAEFNGKANLIYGIFKKKILKKISYLLSPSWGSDMVLTLAAIARGGVTIVEKPLFKKNSPDIAWNIFYKDNIWLRTRLAIKDYHPYYAGLLKGTLKTKYFLTVFVLATYRYMELAGIKLFLKACQGLAALRPSGSSSPAALSKPSFSQSGEDMIVDHIFRARGLPAPTYLDIGAHKPFFLNNTAYFYLHGSTGINIEPNTVLYNQFLKERKKDINLNIGIAAQDGVMDFYVLSADTMSTFSEEQANSLVDDYNFQILEKQKKQVKSINSVLNERFHGLFPHFLSIDVEGLDLEILKTIDYKKNYPLVICVETISYSETGHGIKNQNLIDFLNENHYMVYADTHINTIFVRKDFWIKQGQ